MSMLRYLIGVTTLFAAVSASHAAVAWDEAANGDFSNLGTSPTTVSVAAGSNQVFGESGDLGAGTDLDYFTITVPAGLQLTALWVLPVTAPEIVAFIGIQPGPQVTTMTAEALLGWVHYGANDVGTDLLPRMGNSFGSIGFSGPLGAGTYSFWIQDFDYGVSPYGFDLTIAAVPEPASALALAVGLAVIGWRQRRRVLSTWARGPEETIA